MAIPEAFLLLTLPNTTLSAQGISQSGTLDLECVTIQVPDASNPVERDVYLVLRLGTIETPIDPMRVVQRTDGAGWRTYTFFGTESDPSEMVVSVSPPTPSENDPHFMENLETFETILAQYADLRGSPDSVHVTNPVASGAPVLASGANDIIGSGFPGGHGDLRGHLVVINQSNGEVVGQFDDSKLKVQEDPRLYENGHENDAVIIEVPDTRPGEEQDATALQMFIRAVPPDQQDWITKSATIVSHAISTTTNFLLTTITTASNYYVSHSPPSPHNSRSTQAAGSSTSAPPSRALVFLTSERTRKGLAGVHAVSGQAVKVSSKTVSMIDNMIRRAMGGKPKKPRQFLPGPSSPAAGMLSPTHYPSGTLPSPQLPPRTPSPSGSSKSSHLAPPPAYPGPPSPGASTADKPSLPPRRSTSPVPPPLPPRTVSGAPYDVNVAASMPRGPLSKKERVLLSADLILSTIDHETRRILDTGTQSIGAVVGHKYGPDAAETSLLMAGTARNIGLVYVDMRGIGRRALLKRAGKQFVKAQVKSNKGPEQPQ